MTTLNYNRYPIKGAHSMKVDELSKVLYVNLQTGLEEISINEKITKYDLNNYAEQKKKSILLISFKLLKSPIIILLLVASGFSFFF